MATGCTVQWGPTSVKNKKIKKKNLWEVGRERGGGPKEEESGWEQATEGYKSRAERAIRFRRTMINHGKKKKKKKDFPAAGFFFLSSSSSCSSPCCASPLSKGRKNPRLKKKKKGNHQKMLPKWCTIGAFKPTCRPNFDFSSPVASRLLF